MALEKRRSISIFVTKFLWILFLVLHKSNLVVCEELNDDSLKNALKAIERRQRNLELQENDYYGQPENIGYGFHKTLGFFDNSGPALELGSPDSDPKNDEIQNVLLNYGGYLKDSDFDNGFEKRKSNFRERMSSPGSNFIIKDRDDGEDSFQNEAEYWQLLKNLWAKYLQSRPEEIDLDDLTDDQVEEILNVLFENNADHTGNYYGNANGFDRLEVIPIRNRKNYRVFERFGDRRKRYNNFGDGGFGNRKPYSDNNNINYDNSPESGFGYSYLIKVPGSDPEDVEVVGREGFEFSKDDNIRELVDFLNGVMNQPVYSEEEESVWMPEGQNNVRKRGYWLSIPASAYDSERDDVGRKEKRSEPVPRFFKNHNGIHVNTKRFPVKRSATRVRKEAKNDNVSKEIKGIFESVKTSTVPPKKITTKKPTEVLKKQNVTKPEVTKHHEVKKLVRRADKYTKEQVQPLNANEEIENIFDVKKKSIDWSQYFGIDKKSDRSKNDYLRRAGAHFMAPKNKRLSLDRANVGNVNFMDRSQYEMPFDTRSFNKKSFSYDIGNNIDKVENKIGDIEEKIIADAVKYTGAHSDIGKEDLHKVKNNVIQHLETAYSLEKMKNALEEFKNLIKPEKSEALKKAATEAPKAEVRTPVSSENPNLEKPSSEKKTDSEKRVATKKEGVQKIFNQEPFDSLDFLNDDNSNRQYEDDSCPALDKIMHNCLRVEEMGGRYAELLLPLCSLQQICYICGPEIGFTKASMCSSLYLSETQAVCQDDSACLVSARNTMLALQDLYEQDLMSGNTLMGSCFSNRCIQRFFLSAPGAIYPLEVQN